jgi:hypothetical protein
MYGALPTLPAVAVTAATSLVGAPSGCATPPYARCARKESEMRKYVIFIAIATLLCLVIDMSVADIAHGLLLIQR